MTTIVTRGDARIHSMGCSCRSCRPPAPRTWLQPSDVIALHMIAGVPVGLALAKIIDLIVDGPGLLAAFGL